MSILIFIIDYKYLFINSLNYESLLKKVLSLTPAEVVETVKDSGLRGRGGAAFPTGRKWEQAARVKEDSYILCNARSDYSKINVRHSIQL